MITLGPEKAIYSILLPEVKELLKSTLDESYIHTSYKTYLDDTRLSAISEFREWVRDIIDLSMFKYAYPTNGATHGIDQWLLSNTSSKIQQYPAEYMWAKLQRPDIEVTRYPTERMYLSNPYSATGNIEDKHTQINVPMLMDCAFIGTTAKKRIKITDNIEAITFSLSKSFCLNLFRVGFIFSKVPIAALETLMGYNYYNLPALRISRKITGSFPVDYLHSKLYKSQMEICEENNLTPSDSVIIATTTDSKYDAYKRGNEPINRLCLSREYVARGLGSFSL